MNQILKKIFKKIQKSFIRRFLFLIKQEKFTFKLNNINLYLNIRDSIDREIFFNGYYEEDQIEFLTNNIRKFSIGYFIDVGANIGVYSLRIAKNITNIKIDSFEPHISAYKRFKTNIEINNLKDVIRPHNIALSDVNKEGYLISPSRFGSNQSGGAKVNSEGDIKINQIRGDDIVQVKNERIALKIDVEGFEVQVLKGIENLLKNNEIFLQIEIFDDNFLETSKLLELNNFRLIKSGTFTHQDTVKDYFYLNFNV
tara:strand:+ start:1206 stop:1970 length:765 start_codon:yes stop_codon:yes gene_type:complete